MKLCKSEGKEERRDVRWAIALALLRLTKSKGTDRQTTKFSFSIWQRAKAFSNHFLMAANDSRFAIDFDAKRRKDILAFAF